MPSAEALKIRIKIPKEDVIKTRKEIKDLIELLDIAIRKKKELCGH